MATPWPPVCSYCKAAAGYVAACGGASVWVCKHHVGSAAARWLYDMGHHTVEVRRLVGRSVPVRDLNYLATCVLEDLIDQGALPRMEPEEGKTTDDWAMAHAVTAAALQNGLAHLAQENGETDADGARISDEPKTPQDI